MSQVIVNVRGTSGSGKSTITHDFMRAFPTETLEGPNLRRPDKYEIKGYRLTPPQLKLPIYVVGHYRTACGGCDTVSTPAEVIDRVKAAYDMGGHVLFEGLILSKSGPKGQVPINLKRYDPVYAYLDTPKEVCVERVLARRKEAGNDKPFDPEKSLIPGYETVLISGLKNMRAAGHRTVVIDHTQATKQVFDIFLEEENK
jgi:hypothetical protein